MGRPATAPDDRLGAADGAADEAADGAPGAAEAERESIVRAIGPKVRSLRQSGGLSLQQLARRADVSAAAIHKVERGDMVPTVTTLLKLASALGRPMGHFVDGGGEPEPVADVVRADGRPALPSLPGVTHSGISGNPERFRLRGTVTVLDPGAEFAPEPRAGEDLLVVLEGTPEIDVDDEHHALAVGDAIHLPADRAMRCRNPGPGRAQLLRVSTRTS